MLKARDLVKAEALRVIFYDSAAKRELAFRELEEAQDKYQLASNAEQAAGRAYQRYLAETQVVPSEEYVSTPPSPLSESSGSEENGAHLSGREQGRHEMRSDSNLMGDSERHRL